MSQPVKSSRSAKSRVWIFVVDSRNGDDLRDLDHLDAILWGSNPNARRGDIVLMYRTAPYSDIPYVFTAASDPRPTRRSDRADTDYVITLAQKIRLLRPVTLGDIKNTAALSRWSFARNQQGVMRRRHDVAEEGAWKPLRGLLVLRNRYAADAIRRLERHAVSPARSSSPKSMPVTRRTSANADRGNLRHLSVFLSYGSEDIQRVSRLYSRLRKEKWIDPWLDKIRLVGGDNWEEEIEKALISSDAMVICLSPRSVRRIGFVNTEIGRALRLQDQQPEGTTFILPAKLEACEAPARLSKWQYVELFKRHGFRDLLTGLRKRAWFLARTSRGQKASRPNNRLERTGSAGRSP